MLKSSSGSESSSVNGEEILLTNFYCEEPKDSKKRFKTKIMSCEDEPDETFLERVKSLSSIFPPSIQKPFRTVKETIIKLYQCTCDASWIFFTIVAITYGPVIFETERQNSIMSSPTKKPSPTVEITASKTT